MAPLVDADRTLCSVIFVYSENFYIKNDYKNGFF